MSQLDDVVERVRVDADAIYAFVLSRRGDLVTKGGPREIPEGARKTLSAAADVVAGTDRVVLVKLAHGELVSRAGTLSLDCHVGVAANRAVLCLVVRGGTEARRVTNALRIGLRAIEPMINRAAEKVARSGEATQVTSSRKSRRGRDTSPDISVEPARRLGSETLNAIEKEIQSGPHVPTPHIPREVLRTTLPYRSSSPTPPPEPASAPAKPQRKPKA
ncbi:hypothetical protein [Polyangium fumosum]|uniref:Uncharacterized protein n=1 Tax=Polyangium fumosum TaxID=889272 RepID=A0A4U1JCJ1_9BACT|nr:hypothetical protein [Polyangium fumosum]TKD07839.1 hypothetical protein E8A74_16205 [Polyangium fumosum]